MHSRYLSFLDGLISVGLKNIAPAFLDRHAGFVLSRQSSDGGFTGRAGGSDLYYTAFALRTLALCQYEGTALVQAFKYVSEYGSRINGIVELFDYLSSARILIELNMDFQVDKDQCLKIIESCRAQNGGYRKGKENRISAYATFMSFLCLEMLGKDINAADISALQDLAYSGGGFCETTDSSTPQTSATAAALSGLVVSGKEPESLAQHLKYIGNSQRLDGGLAASTDIAIGDLLSTFSGVTSLCFLGNLNLVNLKNLAKFLKTTARSSGGFVSCTDDMEPDVEYTYYGIAILGILRSYLDFR